MQVVADLQLHSKYSRAVSKHMTLPGILSWAKKKGIDLIATGDWTHPLWVREIVDNLEEIGNGFLRLTASKFETHPDDPLFVLATEVSCIYSQEGKGRRVHILIWVPSLEAVIRINKEMTKRGCNLMSDGRPIIGLTSIEIAELVFSIEPKALIIPAHCWTPWFSVYGSMSGFNSLSEAFGPYSDHIFAVETGLSSNPAMNWQIGELDNRSIVSFSDAHSGVKLGREATVFEFSGQSIHDFKYDYLYAAISEPFYKSTRLPADSILHAIHNENSKVQSKIAYTIEFYPEEGKYHFSGHRACNIRWSPQETQKNGTICPVCGKQLIQGVMQRVEELSTRSENDLLLIKKTVKLDSDSAALAMTKSKTFPERPGFIMLVPLQEIIAECLDSSTDSKKVVGMYDALLMKFGSELNVLLKAQIEEIKTVAGDRISEGIAKVRSGEIIIEPGFDGVFGVVSLWKNDEERPLVDTSKIQMALPL